tara:strand:- start:133 stop:519 length:387 start_codon:yes stop_codon:yes gene_type:complete
MALIEECLGLKNDELSFSSFHEIIVKSTKKDVLSGYITRFGLENALRPENHFVIGYDRLLPALENSTQDFVNVSTITTNDGTYLVFSDYEYLNFIGILKSKRTLNEVRNRMQGSKYYKEKTFKNGKLI